MRLFLERQKHRYSDGEWGLPPFVEVRFQNVEPAVHCEMSIEFGGLWHEAYPFTWEYFFRPEDTTSTT